MASDDTAEAHVDVAIIGFGGAGAAAAITAHDRGARVLVLEKQAREAHTPSTRMLAGAVLCATDIDEATEYLVQCAQGVVSPAACRAWAERAVDLRRWVDALSPAFRLGAGRPGAEHPDLPGAFAMTSHAGERRGSRGGWERAPGPALFDALRHAVETRGIEVRYSSPARRLLTDEAGRVVGVRAVDAATGATVTARNVVLACGGYEFNDDMKRNFLPAHPTYFYGNPGNTGDGVAMAQAVGADLWNMNRIMGRGMGHFEDAEVGELNVLLSLLPTSPEADGPRVGFVITDMHGERFASELGQARFDHSFYFHMLVYDPVAHRHPRIPSYWFFDERRMRAGPLTIPSSGAVAVGLYDWSTDNSSERDRGWIACGSTVEHAARLAGVADPVRAAETVREHNQRCQTGTPDPFGVPPDALVPLDSPPYYCVALWPGGTNTMGGPRRDERARVLDPFGDPIPGLFGAGELGQAMGPLYPGAGGYYSETLCSGRLAGDMVML